MCVDTLGSLIAVGTENGKLHLFNQKSGKSTTIDRQQKMHYRLRFAPQGKQLTGSDWAQGSFAFQIEPEKLGTATINLPESIQPKNLNSNSLEFSPDGKSIAVSYEDENEEQAIVRLFDTQTWKLLQELKVGSFLSQLSFNRTGTLLATTGNDMWIRVFDLDGGDLITTYRRQSARSDEAILLVGDTDPTTVVTFRGGGVVWKTRYLQVRAEHVEGT